MLRSAGAQTIRATPMPPPHRAKRSCRSESSIELASREPEDFVGAEPSVRTVAELFDEPLSTSDASNRPHQRAVLSRDNLYLGARAEVEPLAQLLGNCDLALGRDAHVRIVPVLLTARRGLFEYDRSLGARSDALLRR